MEIEWYVYWRYMDNRIILLKQKAEPLLNWGKLVNKEKGRMV